MKKLKQSYGRVVSGELLFWDREEEIRSLTEKIEEGAHILLVAQRRIGKTSLLAELHRRLSNSYFALFVDLQDARSSPQAITKLSVAMRDHRPMWEKVKDVFANVLEKISNTIEKIEASELSVTLRAGLTAGNWMTKGDQLFDILGESAQEKPVLVMFDEVPIMVNYILKGDDSKITSEGRREADEFLSWLRKNCIKHQGKVRVVISGSIGLEPILRQAKLSATINHFMPIELRPWDEPTAVECLLALAKEYGIQFEKGVVVHVVKLLGCCIPHHVQMFFSHIYDYCMRKGETSCSIKEAKEVYKNEMLGVRGHAELTHYEERLEQVLGKELFTLALDMLTEAAVKRCLSKEAIKVFQKEYPLEGQDIVEAQKEVLWVLEHDGYLKQDEKGYVFVSSLLRDWWENRHGLLFTSVLDRGA